MKIKSTKSIVNLIKKAKSQQAQRRTKKGGDSGVDELAELMRLQREAIQAEMENADGIINKSISAMKGMQKAQELQEEYKQAKTGVQSRYGKIAKAFGLADEKGAAMLDKMFGKKVDESKLAELQKKFKIGEKEEKAKAAKESKKERIKQRDEQLTKIADLSDKIFNLMSGVKSSVDGIANKLRASPARSVPSSKKEMRKIEKQAGLKYAKESNVYRDVKTGKFVGAETARQRMNLSPGTATKVTAVKTAAPAPALASKVLKDETPTGLKSEDPNAAAIDRIDKNTKKTKEGIDEILDMFSLKKFYALIGGAIGAAFPLLKRVVEFVWDFGKKGVAWISDLASSVWEKVRDFLTGIKLDIPKIMGPFTIDLPGMDPFTIGPIGGFTFEPFKFLKKPTEGAQAAPAPPAAAKGPPGRGGARGGAPAAPAPAGGGGGAPAPAAPPPKTAAPPASGGAPAAGGKPAEPPQIPAAPPPAAPPSKATPQGGTMPGAAAPAAGKEKKKADAAGAKQAAIDAATRYGITGSHLAQFLAQIDHESGHFKRLEENLNYSAKRLMEIFPKYYKDPALAEAEQRNPQLIANRVYGGRMGNGPPESGDGYRYRGRGLIQLTGKDNYTRFGKIVGMDLVANPDSAGDLVTAANIAAAYYKKAVLDAGIQAEDTKRVTKAVNGGSIGLSDRENLFALYQQQAPGSAPGAPPGGPVYAASGGVASGPRSGYPATLHGTEAIIPLDGQSHQSKQAVAAVGKAVSGEDMKNQTAENTMASNAPAVVPVPVGGGGGGGGGSAAKSQPDNSIKASVRHQDNAFMRAIAHDFSHPSSFSSVVV